MECGGHDECLFRTGFLKLSVLTLKRHWSGVNALHIVTQQTTTSYMFYVCPTVSTHWCLRLKIQCPPPCLQKKITSFLWKADLSKSLLLLQSYKCLLMVLRGMSKAGCFLVSFRTLQPKRVFNKVFLTLNSFSNNTYTPYTYMHIHRYEYIYISFVPSYCFLWCWLL